MSVINKEMIVRELNINMSIMPITKKRCLVGEEKAIEIR